MFPLSPVPGQGAVEVRGLVVGGGRRPRWGRDTLRGGGARREGPGGPGGHGQGGRARDATWDNVNKQDEVCEAFERECYRKL